MAKLNLDEHKIARGRELAGQIAEQVQTYINAHSTVTVERAVLRLLGIDGVDQAEVPLVNGVVERLHKAGVLGKGAMYWVVNAMLYLQQSPQQIAEAVIGGQIILEQLPEKPAEEIAKLADSLAEAALSKIHSRRRERENLISRLGKGLEPMVYVIVATGNVYEDAVQAQAAARQGADIIAVIRTTGQSLLDYVPYGPTTTGFGGTYATQENFRIIRQALDEVGQEVNRYIYLTNYCSGLCMPEIAVMGALERLDVMLNDSMYGIIFRDINMKRTFVDQFFSRLLNGFAGIIINTGEDNYLTTADAIEAAHTVLASDLINEQFAFRCGMVSEQLGLGHAFEVDPETPNGFLYELSQAQLIREVFPDSPIKYMPPTKYMTGNIFKGHVQDALFNVCSIMTGQGIQLLGMLTEAIHTPHIQDRFLSIQSAKYIFNTMRDLSDEIYYRSDGFIEQRAREVLDNTVGLLEQIADIGLMQALSNGYFADIARTPEGGKGLEGVFDREPGYLNPFIGLMLQGGREND
ncbi:lysine 5,6-aminomutase subunit alpha [Sporomusa malonica]|uniref:Beta-lysine 5,6-aminomutase alpha subunit /D-lysine 5,6-aminomutase alpha subunit n=1 Tax=Sporomusa malonica TaxID=112901 RepID=A0A1W2E0C3_9FIRM|nr:lysine 5,6-aminomutase subunit alpha [Sporomusa malonica]SMD03190.1 beta-lysine 5,6-aminomutase alpha subunit /D-lysine 5,6-aminomutase alpha subunit [Sporomusa malonica]